MNDWYLPYTYTYDSATNTAISPPRGLFRPIRGVEAENEHLVLVDPAALVGQAAHDRGTAGAELEALSVTDLAYIQFNDALPLESSDLMSETLQRRTLPGHGEFDLTRFCEIVRAKGYAGPVAVEIMSSTLRTEGPEAFARQACAAARPYWP